ncbi:MAG: cupin domain-containing protein [Phycisphaeraceae bacterium]|nr:cupin domain-containing protein [Phycisphaeraceae bacterium]
MNRNIGKLDRQHFGKAHNNSMFVQQLFPGLEPDRIRPDTFAYGPCWGILDPGMTMEKHHHPIPEFYVFTQGRGRMTLGKDTFDVHSGMSINIPPDVEHEVTNDAGSIEPLVWVSIGLKE